MLFRHREVVQGLVRISKHVSYYWRQEADDTGMYALGIDVGTMWT